MPTKKTKKTVKISSKKKLKIKTSTKKRTVHVRVPANATVTVTVGAEKPRDTIVSFLLDESGSMADCLQATIGGFNEYISGLRKNKTGKVDFSLTKFKGNNVVVVHNATPITLVSELNVNNYRPGGGTPLYDAIGKTIRSLENALAGRFDKPAVLFTIMTDGQENASWEYTKETITALIKQKERDGWDFTYLGANHDAYAASSSIGLSLGNTVHYDAKNSKDVFVTLCASTMGYVASNASGQSVTRNALFSSADKALMEKGVDTTTDTGTITGKVL